MYEYEVKVVLTAGKKITYSKEIEKGIVAFDNLHYGFAISIKKFKQTSDTAATGIGTLTTTYDIFAPRTSYALELYCANHEKKRLSTTVSAIINFKVDGKGPRGIGPATQSYINCDDDRFFRLPSTTDIVHQGG